MTFILRFAASQNKQWQLPLEWKHVLAKLTPLTFFEFDGCSKCGRYVFMHSSETTCKTCKKPRSVQRILYTPVLTWLKFMFKYSTTFATHCQTQFDTDAAFYSDWHNGEYCINVMREFNGKKTVYISTASDGLALFKTRNSSLTPLFFVINNLPPSHRKDLRFYFPVSVMETLQKDYSDLQQFLFFSELEFLQYHGM